MDGVTLTDSISTANGTGTSLNSQSSLEAALGLTSGQNAFHVSCANLYNGASSSGASIFATSGSLVDFTKALADIFPN